MAPADFAKVAPEDPLTAEKKDVWPLWKLVLIALPQLGVQVLWCFIGPNSADYMLHLGIGPALATLNNIAGPITGFFTGPLVGATSDQCTSRFGRRRPVILAGLISVWIAGVLFASSEHIFSGSTAVAFAAPMYWIMDITINILQTPHRALVADLASPEQQVPMQVVFVVMMACGNFIAFSIMQVYPEPVQHMLELMLYICGFNTLCVGIQFLVAKETPHTRDPQAPAATCCSPLAEVAESVKGMPGLLYHLAAVQCLVWIGNTAWNLYGGQWMAYSVYGGVQRAEPGTPERTAYEAGKLAFSLGGQCKALLQLVSALVIIAILLKTPVRPRLVYAPCLFVGALFDFLAAFAVGSSGIFAMVCLAVSVMPETGSFAIPFGLVATLNKRAEEEGKHVSTALQMALINCCVTVGQQICTLTLACIQGKMTLATSLPCILAFAGVTHGLGGFTALFLDDRPADEQPADEHPASRPLAA
mmetsp:Transcript_85405/g.249993  ORF Transcript_85405/g.249993 Transcript_85405/m.249993 type:complete len:475 (-) Transcript_85405:465-1889(-)